MSSRNRLVLGSASMLVLLVAAFSAPSARATDCPAHDPYCCEKPQPHPGFCPLY